MDRKIKIKTINCYITCNICKGYLIGATAITECLHTFCKSCIIKHLEGNTTCPTCNIIIHHSYPRQYIKFDRTLQDIVYKLVPGLQTDEIEREKDFYRQRGLPYPIDIPINDEMKEDEPPDSYANTNYCPNDELITINLECISTNLMNLKKKIIRVATKATILQLTKFIACKLLNKLELYKDIEVYCNFELLEKSDTLKSVYLTKWRIEEVPLILQYKFKYYRV